MDSFFEPEEKTEKVHLGWKEKVIGVGAATGLAGILAGFLRAGLPVEGCLLAAAAAGICLVCWIVRRNMLEKKELEEEMGKYLQSNWLTGESKEVEKGVQIIQEEEEEETAYLGPGGLREKTDEARAWLIPSEPVSYTHLFLISKALGHRQIATTEKYLDVGSDELAEAAEQYYQKHKGMFMADRLL